MIHEYFILHTPKIGVLFFDIKCVLPELYDSVSHIDNKMFIHTKFNIQYEKYQKLIKSVHFFDTLFNIYSSAKRHTHIEI